MEMMIPADIGYALAVGLAMDGLGMKAGLDMDALSDLRSLCKESIDTLIHQPTIPVRVKILAETLENRIKIVFSSENRSLHACSENFLSTEFAKSILETLVPDIQIESDINGIFRILCFMPI